MIHFFDLYNLMEESSLPGPGESVTAWLGSFVGKTGRQVFDWCVNAHHKLEDEKGDADADEHHKAALALLKATGDFVMRKQLGAARDIHHKTANPSWWEKDNGGHDHFQELLKKKASPEDLKSHPWYKRHRTGHEDHWRAVATSMNDTVSQESVDLDESDEAATFRDAWAAYHRHVGKHPESQWADRRKKPKVGDHPQDETE